MLNMSAQEASPGLWSVAAASQNNHLRHVCICASCRRPIVEFALMQETARTLWEQPGGSNINLPSRIRTTELKFGWWLLTWLDSSTVFSMTEPAWSARSNSFRQLPLRLLLDGKNTVQQPPNRMGWQEDTRWRRATKGGRRKCGFDEALLQTPDTHTLTGRELSNCVQTFLQQLTRCQTLWGNTTRYPQSNAVHTCAAAARLQVAVTHRHIVKLISCTYVCSSYQHTHTHAHTVPSVRF